MSFCCNVLLFHIIMSQCHISQAQTQQMCPDVSSLCVNPKDAPKTGTEGRHGWAVSMKQVIIVLQPIGEEIVWNNSPTSFPNLVMARVCFNTNTLEIGHICYNYKSNTFDLKYNHCDQLITLLKTYVNKEFWDIWRWTSPCVQTPPSFPWHGVPAWAK